MKAPKLGTRRWAKLRARMLMRDLYRCRYGFPGCTGDATQVDHVWARGDGGAWWDEENLLSTCNACHREKERRVRTGEPLGVFLRSEGPGDAPVSALSPLITGDYSRKKAGRAEG